MLMLKMSKNVMFHFEFNLISSFATEKRILLIQRTKKAFQLVGLRAWTSHTRLSQSQQLTILQRFYWMQWYLSWDFLHLSTWILQERKSFSELSANTISNDFKVFSADSIYFVSYMELCSHTQCFYWKPAQFLTVVNLWLWLQLIKTNLPFEFPILFRNTHKSWVLITFWFFQLINFIMYGVL